MVCYINTSNRIIINAEAFHLKHFDVLSEMPRRLG